MIVPEKRILVVVVVALLALGGALAWALTDDEESAPVEVSYIENGQAPQMLAVATAIDRASTAAGYAVRVPTVLPDPRLKLQGINLVRPAEIPHAIAITSVFFAVPPPAGSEAPALVIQIDQTGGPFAANEKESEPIDLGIPGARASTQTNANGLVSYWVAGAERGYLVMLSGKDIPSRQAVIPMLRELAR